VGIYKLRFLLTPATFESKIRQFAFLAAQFPASGEGAHYP